MFGMNSVDRLFQIRSNLNLLNPDEVQYFFRFHRNNEIVFQNKDAPKRHISAILACPRRLALHVKSPTSIPPAPIIGPY